ncbi:hypothetical protein WA026_018341 [Henosepilachna vigintioctopunctata]|uniref:Uncharacterized protein n=1 Tax=Henosepilachna vigintioctopunctata TaxID=420089 RepID=A0AAW1VIC2_9CUCU
MTTHKYYDPSWRIRRKLAASKTQSSKLLQFTYVQYFEQRTTFHTDPSTKSPSNIRIRKAIVEYNTPKEYPMKLHNFTFDRPVQNGSYEHFPLYSFPLSRVSISIYPN